MVQDAFAVGLKHPCSEAGMAVVQPPLGLSFFGFGLSPPLPSVLSVLNNQPLRRFASEGLAL
jgi:hypothetical protein